MSKYLCKKCFETKEECNCMKEKDKEYVITKIENEGFNYCFMNYSSFEEIKDEEFHKLMVEEFKELINKELGIKIRYIF